PGGQVLTSVPQKCEMRLPAKFATHTLPPPSVARSQGAVRPPPVKVVSWAGVPSGRSSVNDPIWGSTGGRSGHGKVRIPELATHTLPSASASMPNGWSRPPPVIGGPATVPSRFRRATLLLAAPV